DEEAPSAANGHGAAMEERAQTVDVLVVEDNPDIRATLREALEINGHHVETADDGNTGVELVLSHAPRLALIDIGLPGIDGYQVARELRLRMKNRRTHLVALTGYGQPSDRRRALEAGFDEHLVKPIDFEDLNRLLKRLDA